MAIKIPQYNRRKVVPDGYSAVRSHSTGAVIGLRKKQTTKTSKANNASGDFEYRRAKAAQNTLAAYAKKEAARQAYNEKRRKSNGGQGG